MKVLFCTSEVMPFAKTGGLGDVCAALPQALGSMGVETAIALPYYKSVDAALSRIKKLNHDVYSTTLGEKIPVYLIASEKFSARDGLYGDQKGDYPDNLSRFGYFCRRTLELLKEIGLQADILHCHDWQTALIPIYLKFVDQDPFYQDMKSILTIHNLAYQGIFPAEQYSHLGLPKTLYSKDGFEFYKQISLLKGGILFSDVVTTVSPNYAKEILTKAFGCGLEDILYQRKDVLNGILNGIDEELWNPETDEFICQKYSSRDMKGKSINKSQLQEKFKLPVNKRVPLFGFVGRLSHQKGVDLIEEAFETLVEFDMQLVVLGVGDEKIQTTLQEWAGRYPEKIAVQLNFDEKTAHKIYAGSDMFLMPSVFEPCGLSQLISFKYGTIPVVFRTGGLADTVYHFNDPQGRGNGFVFEEYGKDPFLNAVKEAMKVFHQKEIFMALMKKAMSLDFSWKKSAKAYHKMYARLIGA